MPRFRITFAKNDEPEVVVCEFVIDHYLEGEAIEAATEMFHAKHPGKDLANYEVRSRDAG